MSRMMMATLGTAVAPVPAMGLAEPVPEPFMVLLGTRSVAKAHHMGRTLV
jgi:hypothetical protein